MDDLRRTLTDRLVVLRRESELGEERLRTLENEVLVLRQTLLRIGGAIQVLREVLDEQPDAPAEQATVGADRGSP